MFAKHRIAALVVVSILFGACSPQSTSDEPDGSAPRLGPVGSAVDLGDLKFVETHGTVEKVRCDKRVDRECESGLITALEDGHLVVANYGSSRPDAQSSELFVIRRDRPGGTSDLIFQYCEGSDCDAFACPMGLLDDAELESFSAFDVRKDCPEAAGRAMPRVS